MLSRNEWQHITGVSALLPRNKKQAATQVPVFWNRFHFAKIAFLQSVQFYLSSVSCDPVAQQFLVLPGLCLQGVPGKSFVAWAFLAAFNQAPPLALRALYRPSQMWTSSLHFPSWSSASRSWSGCQTSVWMQDLGPQNQQERWARSL